MSVAPRVTLVPSRRLPTRRLVDVRRSTQLYFGSGSSTPDVSLQPSFRISSPWSLDLAASTIDRTERTAVGTPWYVRLSLSAFPFPLPSHLPFLFLPLLPYAPFLSTSPVLSLCLDIGSRLTMTIPLLTIDTRFAGADATPKTHEASPSCFDCPPDSRPLSLHLECLCESEWANGGNRHREGDEQEHGSDDGCPDRRVARATFDGDSEDGIRRKNVGNEDFECCSCVRRLFPFPTVPSSSLAT
jgi:hypothetical protein